MSQNLRGGFFNSHCIYYLSFNSFSELAIVGVIAAADLALTIS